MCVCLEGGVCRVLMAGLAFLPCLCLCLTPWVLSEEVSGRLFMVPGINRVCGAARRRSYCNRETLERGSGVTLRNASVKIEHWLVVTKERTGLRKKIANKLMETMYSVV